MAVNYDDKRFTSVKNQERAAEKELNRTYDGMIRDSQEGYNDQIQASKDWVDKQTELQNENTEFAIEKIEQQKGQAEKDYLKEQSGAYADWQKQSNQYEVKAEQQASLGMANTGYSESSQVSMYNTYQNRVMAARESYSRAVLNYDNAIKEAKLQNNSLLAEIAYQGLQEQLSLGIEAMQYKNTLIIQKSAEKRAINQDYYNRWRDVLSQINTENAQAEQQRQFNENLALQKAAQAEQKRQFDAELALKNSQFAWQKEQANKASSGGSSSGGSIKKSSSGGSSSKKSSTKEKQNLLISTYNKNKKSDSSSSSSKSYTAGQKSKDPEVDMQSVLALGYGPISASELNRKIQMGQVIEYVDNKTGKLKYKKAFGSFR